LFKADGKNGSGGRWRWRRRAFSAEAERAARLKMGRLLDETTQKRAMNSFATSTRSSVQITMQRATD
jgi:hypothetical protein